MNKCFYCGTATEGERFCSEACAGNYEVGMSDAEEQFERAEYEDCVKELMSDIKKKLEEDILKNQTPVDPKSIN